MLPGLKSSCQCLTGWWAPQALAAAATASAAVQQQLPRLSLAPFHTGSCQQQDSNAPSWSSSVELHISTSPAAVSSMPSPRKRAAQIRKLQLPGLHNIIQQNLAEVPAAARTGDQPLLTDEQRQSMAIFRRFNISQPHLRGQVILAKVLQSAPKHLLVDPGYYGMNVVSRQELASAAPYDEQGRPLPPRSVIHPGEYVAVRLSAFNTPYGDAQLDPVGIPYAVRQKLVWEELQQRMKRGDTVKGRILNATAGGFAVGMAGYVALLQRNQANVQQARRIGVLQDFYIHQMDRQQSRITLSNVARNQQQDIYNDYRMSL